MRITALLLLMGVIACLPFTALADSHENPPNVASVWVMTPNGDPAVFEAALKTHGEWRAENGDPRDWHIYTVEAGEDFGKYYVRYCCFHWADQDAYQQWAAESGALQAYNDSVAPLVGDVGHHFQVVDIENSNWAPGLEPALVGVTTWTPNPAKSVQMGATMAQLSQLAKDKEWPYNWAWFRSLGGEANLSVAVPYANFAAMAPPEKTFFEFAGEHMGEEEAAAMFNQFNESFWDSEYTIYRLRPDLSMSSDD